MLNSSSSSNTAGQPQQQQQPVDSAAPAGPAGQLDTAAAAAEAEAYALEIKQECLLMWRCHARTWQSQIGKDCHRTFPGHYW